MNEETCIHCDEPATYRTFVWATEELQTIDGDLVKEIYACEDTDKFETYCDEHARNAFPNAFGD